MSMGKRKRDIFTVREVVPNWLEASEGDNEYPEVGSEIYVEGHPGQVRASEVPVPQATSAEVHMDTPTGQGLANMFQFTQLPPAVTGWVSPGGRGSLPALQPAVFHPLVQIWLLKLLSGWRLPKHRVLKGLSALKRYQLKVRLKGIIQR